MHETVAQVVAREIAGFLVLFLPAVLASADPLPPLGLKLAPFFSQYTSEKLGFDHSLFMASDAATESNWNAFAVSPAGARGLMQIMPATAKWGARSFAAELGPPNLLDPDYSAKFAVLYFKWIDKHNPGWATPGDQWAANAAAYNAGLGNIKKEKRLAAKKGLPGNKWWDGVETVCTRAPRYCKESHEYPKRIDRWMSRYKKSHETLFQCSRLKRLK